MCQVQIIKTDFCLFMRFLLVIYTLNYTGIIKERSLILETVPFLCRPIIKGLYALLVPFPAFHLKSRCTAELWQRSYVAEAVAPILYYIRY